MSHSIDTVAVHAGESPDPTTGALEPPVVLSNAFAFAGADEAAARFRQAPDAWVYGRWGNPTVAALEQKLAALEGAESAVALASGMAAVHAAIASQLTGAGHVVAASSLYSETARLLTSYFARFGVETSFVDATRPNAVRDAIRPTTALVYVETPSNPVLDVVDLSAVATIADGIPLIVDSTFATPYHQRPLEHGAALVVHSATKGLAGHGDVLGGVVAGSRARIAEVRQVAARMCGSVLSPLAAMLVARGVRTLALRMDRASSSALQLADRLSAHPAVAAVRYPGLATHPGSRVAARQMERGFGALIAFEVRGGREAGAKVYDRVRLVTRAVSLGDVRTLITHPASTTHASWSAEQRRAARIGDGLMRLSVGVEDVDDLWRDLSHALG